jgi:hypothetical protein
LKSFSTVVLACLFCTCQKSLPDFDSANAYDLLRKQCEFGPRVPGSEAHEACQKYLLAELGKYADQAVPQRFPASNPFTGEKYQLTNIIASFGLDKTERILLCAHWDTRPWADEDPDETNRDKPVPGANDGASGVAVLLEIARILRTSPPKYGVDIILFDGEDLGISGKPETYALGSQYFARTRDKEYKPRFGILLDMVGDKDLQIYQEGFSLQYAGQVVKRVWEKAAEMNLPAFVPRFGHQVADDHVALLNVGISCIDLIDFDYKYWHTIEDTPDKCSPESLEQVGRLLLGLLYE